MPAKAKVLIVEDEKAIANFLTAILTADDYRVIHAFTGKEGISLAASYNPDIVLLDLGLSDLDGSQVLERIRQWSDVPVIIVSARHDEHEKVQLLDAGANDYITKPFSNGELLARIRTATRLYLGKSGSEPAQSGPFRVGELSIDYVNRKVSLGGKSVHVTPTEYRILVLLSRNAGRVMTHDSIIKEIWGPFGADSQMLRVNMANIRRKLEAEPGDPKFILTEIGVGYKMSGSDYVGY